MGVISKRRGVGERDLIPTQALALNDESLNVILLGLLSSLGTRAATFLKNLKDKPTQTMQ